MIILWSSSLFCLARSCVPKRCLRNFKARFSRETFKNSIHLLSYGANPQISRTRSRINLLWTVILPFLLTWRGLNSVFCTLCPLLRPMASSNGRPILITDAFHFHHKYYNKSL